MPISTSSNEWNNADGTELLRDSILEFLREHPNQAFYARELADEIIGTQWAAGDEKERLIQKVGEDEYWENCEEYEAQLDETQESVMGDAQETAKIHLRLGDLMKEGLVEGRKIPAEHTDIPYDWGNGFPFYIR